MVVDPGIVSIGETVPTVRVVPGVGIGGWMAIGMLDCRMGSCLFLFRRSLVESGPDCMCVRCTATCFSDNGIVLKWNADPKWAAIVFASWPLHLSGSVHRVRSCSWAEEVKCSQA